MSARVDEYLAFAKSKAPLFPKDITGKVEKGDLLELHAIVRDGTRRLDWAKALFAITIIEEPHAAFNTIIDFIQQVRETGNFEFEKVSSVVYLGWLPKEVSGPFLRRAVTHEGAQEVLAPWRESGYRNMDDLEIQLRAKAANGIALLDDQEGLAIVRQEYLQLRAISPDERRRDRIALWLLPGLREALAVHDMCSERGVEDATLTIVQERRNSSNGGSDSLWPYFRPYVEAEQAMWGVDHYGP